MKTEVRRQKVFFDKNVLSYGSSIGKVKFCVKTKAITLYANEVGLLFLSKVRDVDQEETGARLEDR